MNETNAICFSFSYVFQGKAYVDYVCGDRDQIGDIAEARARYKF